ncbi:hypothetical protein MYEC719_p20055 (plasmid) [Escherichia coli]|nr:hypothetical protein MYEC719_p20055 [Escherichia coli]
MFVRYFSVLTIKVSPWPAWINVIALRPELNKADRSFRIKSGQGEKPCQH